VETIAGWARELSDVGGPNTLLWAPTRRDGFLELTTAHPGGVSMLLAGRPTRLSDLVREPGAFDDALDVARRVHQQAVDLLEHRGLACGFVAMGVATWDPPRARAVVEAPVLLRTCTLRPTTVAESDFELDLGPTVEVNPALVNYLRSVAGIEVDPTALAALADGAYGFDPYPVYAALARLCADVPGFSVTPRLALATYPYVKLAMVADVSGNTRWLSQVDFIAALAGDEGATTRLSHAPLEPLVDPDPEREVLPLDLDPMQHAVVEATRRDTGVALRAPRGTGRTQTLAAVVAAAAFDERRVLYVTRHRQSVRDLRARLASAGLGDLVLDLTGSDAGRGGALEELAAAVAMATARDESTSLLPDARGAFARAFAVAEARDELAGHVAALHKVRQPWGVTAYQVQEAMAALATQAPAPGSRVRIAGAALRALSRERIDELAAHLADAAAAGAWAVGDGNDPWYAADIRTEDEVVRAKAIVQRFAGDGFASAAKELDGILAESSLKAARTPLDWDRALRTMSGVRETLEVFRPEIFDIPLDEHVAATGTRDFRDQDGEADLGLVTRSRVRRQARRLLRPGRPPQDLHAELVSAREQRNAWHDLVGAGGRPEISPRLDEAQALYDNIASDLTWLQARLEPTEAGGNLLGTSMPLVRGRINRLAERLERLEILPKVTAVVEELRAAGMGAVIDDFARRGVAADQVRHELDHIWWASIGQDITSSDRRYSGHDGVRLRDRAGQLAEHESTARADARERITRHTDALIRRRSRDNQRQAQLLRSQGAGVSARARLAFADVVREGEDLVAAARPCLAMSPYAVAQLLAPGTSFDLVIIDDATSLTVAEAISALSRGRQVVVASDPYGPQPEPFRVGQSVDLSGDGGGLGVAASLPASLATRAQGLLSAADLTWWHGTADPRLRPDDLAGTVEGVPSAVLADPIDLVTVEGVVAYAPGADQPIESSESEVAAVVAAVLDHARARPNQSLAVVGLTGAIVDGVRARLREAVAELADDDAAMAFLAGSGDEPFVVTSFERAAGLERDVVILAMGYGRTPHGRVLHRFPSVDAPAAASALAAVRRAPRHRLVVVTALSSADLVASRLKSPGARALRDLLVTVEAATGAGADSSSSASSGAKGGVEAPAVEGQSDSALMAYLAARLREEGLTVAHEVGVGAHVVELAVGHPDLPGRYLVAVESDGPRYAARQGVRSRDRLRPDQVERAGWRFVRVWSTDLYRDPAREVARIAGVVREMVRAARPTRVPVPAPVLAPESAAEGGADGGPVSGESTPEVGEEATTADAQPGEVVTAGQEAEPAERSQSPEVAPVGSEGTVQAAADAESTREPTPKAAPRRRPEQTRDDTDAGWGERRDDDAHDRWLQEQRPPHWE
jgi:very-short-patch-repair endonuclease